MLKKYSKPTKPFDKVRITEEDAIVEKYGLKNKREIWKAEAAIVRIRNLAKQLITKSEDEKQAFVDRLKMQGFKINSIPDALALNKEDFLKRRLQTIVHLKKLTTTPKQARQLIVHKHVSVGSQIVNIPSYLVSLEEEPHVKLNIVLKIKEPKESKEEKIKREMEEKAESIEETEEIKEEKLEEALLE